MTFAQIRKQITRPGVAGGLGVLLILLVGVGIGSLRHGVIDYLQVGSEWLFVEGILDEEEPGDPGTDVAGGAEEESDPGESPKRSGFKRVVSAPVRLVFGVFRRKPRSLMVRKASEEDVERMKMIPMQRTRTGNPDPVAEYSPATSSAASVAQSAARKIFEEAVQLQEQGRVDAALEKLVAATVLQPKYAEAYNLLGICYDQKRQYASAQSEYHKAIELDRSNARYLNNLGYSYYLSGNDKESVKWYRRGIKISPLDRRLHNNLGLALGRKGEYAKAREHFVQAVGDAGAHLNLGYILNQQGKYEEAIQQYQLALKGQPSSLPAMSQLAQLYERTGRLREAAQVGEEYRRMVALQQQREGLAEQR
jgi:Flp pilus assembly protein TadD